MRCKKKTCTDEHVTRLGLPACVAHKKSTGKACQANPVRGATVCSKHGGQIGAIKRNAAARVAEARIERTMGDLLREHDIPDRHPFAALLDLSRRMDAMTRTLEQIVTEYRTSGDDDRLQAALGMYERFGRLSTQVSKTVLDANLDERLVRVNEAQSDVLFQALDTTLRRLGFDEALLAQAAPILIDELAAYADGRRALPTPTQRPTYRPAHMDRH